MCNLYSMTRPREAMLRLFHVGDNRAALVEPKTAIFPGYVAPVVRKAATANASSQPQLGFRAAAERPSPAARDQRA